MRGIDNATWQALGLIVTLLGFGVSAVVWTRRGPVSGLRAVAWSLLPLAAGLTGVLRLGADITGAVGRWATRLVFSPVVWLGLVVAGVSLLLLAVTGYLGRRSAAKAPRHGPVAAGTPAPVLTKRSRKAAAPPGSAAGDPDLADIEEILRRRGIS